MLMVASTSSAPRGTFTLVVTGSGAGGATDRATAAPRVT
jgi:hypothetical protein